MTLATIKGRLQTKVITFAIAAPIAYAFRVIDDCTVYYTMFALMILFGLTLEAAWGLFFAHEPGWLTILFAVIEFSLIFTIIKFFQLDILFSNTVATFSEGVGFYLTAWLLTQIFLIYVLPIWRTSWIQDGGELW